MKYPKYALLVGINAYQQSPLNGCVNDVLDLRERLIVHDFHPDNIRVLLDKRATHNAIRERLQWLLTKNGVLVFSFSGHGSNVRTRKANDVLEDYMTEVLCPWDYEDHWDAPLSDDVLANNFKQLKPDSRLTVILDACHSGTATRAVASATCVGGRPRYLAPPRDINLRAIGVLPVKRLGLKAKPKTFDVDPTMRHVLLAACQSSETAADTMYGQRSNGAFTYSLLQAMKKLGAGHTWVDYMLETQGIIKADGFEQNPTLEGAAALVNGYPFV